MANVAQQGQTAALHVLVQFPTHLIPADEIGQQAMLWHARRFVNEFHGGEAVFAARLDRDETGGHTVDVFAMPIYTREYKDGRTARRASVSKFSKQHACKRYGRDDRRAQGSALQAAWHEYLRDEMGLEGVLPPTPKAALAADRVEPEVYKLTQDKRRFEASVDRARRIMTGVERLAARAGRVLPEVAQLRQLFRTFDAQERE